jgi:flagellar biosynthesis protein FlhG
VQPPAQEAAPARPPAPAIGPETEFTGSLLRQLREARGADLQLISHRTKIAVSHLQAIEDERFQVMPAPVYVRGFLVEIGRFLKVDVERLLATYFVRFKAAKEVE